MTASTVILIGAPRSGTNLLRDVLTSFEGVVTWPCDEINYIWRHGNVRYPSDEFPLELATERVAKYIRSEFDKLKTSRRAEIVVEKTCANSLRVPFVAKVIADAKFINIYRNGLDAIGSARLRWIAELDIKYVLKKARYVPMMDLPYYAGRFMWNRFYRMVSREKRLAFWGPSLSNMDLILKTLALEEICALQWKSCVENAEIALAGMPRDKVMRVDYDRFVNSPEPEVLRMLAFIGIERPLSSVRQAIKHVSNSSIGKGSRSLKPEQIATITQLIGDTVGKYGYR